MATRDARGGRSDPQGEAVRVAHHPTGDPAHSENPEHHDRWAWRRKIRADPHKARIYRVLIGVLGTLLILFGIASGPLPGPGGIPLVLLGLAVWASEFAWAHRLMQWVKRQLHALRGWSRPKQVLAWVIFFVLIGALGYADLLVLGIPTWAPHAAAVWLTKLPGVS